MGRKRYEWKPNSRISGVDAQSVGQELDRIRRRDGHVTVDAMLEEARPEDAVLHNLCTWDDEIAGEKWRKHELRQVPRSLRVITSDSDSYPAYVHIKAADATQGYYQDTKVAVRNIDEYSLAFAALSQHMNAVNASLRDLERVASGGDTDRDRERRALLLQVDQALKVASAALQQAS